MQVGVVFNDVTDCKEGEIYVNKVSFSPSTHESLQ